MPGRWPSGAHSTRSPERNRCGDIMRNAERASCLFPRGIDGPRISGVFKQGDSGFDPAGLSAFSKESRTRDAVYRPSKPDSGLSQVVTKRVDSAARANNNRSTGDHDPDPPFVYADITGTTHR